MDARLFDEVAETCKNLKKVSNCLRSRAIPPYNQRLAQSCHGLPKGWNTLDSRGLRSDGQVSAWRHHEQGPDSSNRAAAWPEVRPMLLAHAQKGEFDLSFLATHRFSLEDGPTGTTCLCIRAMAACDLYSCQISACAVWAVASRNFLRAPRIRPVAVRRTPPESLEADESLWACVCFCGALRRGSRSATKPPQAVCRPRPLRAMAGGRRRQRGVRRRSRRGR